MYANKLTNSKSGYIKNGNAPYRASIHPNRPQLDRGIKGSEAQLIPINSTLAPYSTRLLFLSTSSHCAPVDALTAALTAAALTIALAAALRDGYHARI